MPYTKTPPAVSVPDGPNDLEETVNLRKVGPEVIFEYFGGRLDVNRPHVVQLSRLATLTPAQIAGWRAVMLAARDFVYTEDGYTKS